jgi:hypothetical protein
VCIALVVTRDGFPLGYEVFDGNRTDVTTVEDIVEEMEDRYGAASRVWVMDRGMVSRDNVEFLKAGKRRYIVGTPRGMLKKFGNVRYLRVIYRRRMRVCRVGIAFSPSGARPTSDASAASRAQIQSSPDQVRDRRRGVARTAALREEEGARASCGLRAGNHVPVRWKPFRTSTLPSHNERGGRSLNRPHAMRRTEAPRRAFGSRGARVTLQLSIVG